MAINFDNALGLHPAALKLREQRAEILAANLANADTPNFKARDVDFAAVLAGVQRPQLALQTTHAAHLAPPAPPLGPELLYRNPYHASLDGNTVETDQEYAKNAENTVQYQASLRFLGSRFQGLVSAIKGE